MKSPGRDWDHVRRLIQESPDRDWKIKKRAGFICGWGGVFDHFHQLK